ncbi:neuroligin-like protein glit-1 isoform X1 [Glossina fuscipes]|uniref:Neuroligin-like protein glit-1 isoform X1 n=2 Tax=Glossina fuscipes TaxID=7396 RepID=A0A9C5Z919_9MUSC|nr:neuroligin-like protein glit-1 isoform X1 [Glossina fuscipes]
MLANNIYSTAVSMGTTFETMLPPLQLSKTKYITNFFETLKTTLRNTRKLPNSTHRNNQCNNNTPAKIQQCTNKVQYRHKQKKCSVDAMLVKLAVVGIMVFSEVEGQTRTPWFHPREDVGNYRWPNPGDSDYRTYIFNGRRYGHYPSSDYSLKVSDRNEAGLYPEATPHKNSPNSGQVSFPGILAGWREDLQGKERRDSSTLERDVFVTTNYGQVQGFKVYMYDNPDPKSFYRPYHSTLDRVMGECTVFLGIPYAMPPTFEGRFKPPRVHRGWQLMQAVDFGPACPQPLHFIGTSKGINDMDEDCLYLNIFSPQTGAGVAQKYPVMVYIHGGEFMHGASNLFQGHILASFYGVVVVTLNYRLGALGFLSTADENSPGNYGILDQAMALRWIYDNIEFFNGDRESITLFGPGAGAASAGLLMVAPSTRNIVKRVIAQSGSALADWALIHDKYRAQNTSRVFGRLLGCSIESSWKLVNCLRIGRTSHDLGKAEFPPDVGTFAWGPVLDKNFTVPGDDWYDGWREKDWHFLTETPLDLVQQGKFNQELHYMAGVTTQEAAFFISQNKSLAPYYQIDMDFFDQKIREHVFHYNYTLNPLGVYEAIKYMYTYWPDPNNTTILRDQYINMLSDLYYRAPVDQMIKLLLERKVPVYSYVLNTTVEALNLPDWRKYPHEIEHYFLTGAPFMDVEFFPKKDHVRRNMWTDNDRNMSHFFLQIFSNFARYGNPTPQQVLGLHFEQAYQGNLRYLNINTTFNSTIMLNYRQTESAFWTEYLPTVVGVLVPTYPPTTEFWWEPKEPLQIAFWSMSVICFFLIVLVVICCIMWRNAKRQSDRYYDDDVFFNAEGTEYDEEPRAAGVDNTHMITSQHGIKQRNNVYQYSDSASAKTLTSKALTETSSIRSPSSLTMPQKSGSQLSLKSTVPLKESNGGVSTYTTTRLPNSEINTPTESITNDDLATVVQPHVIYSIKTTEEKSLLQNPCESLALSRTPPKSEVSYQSAKPLTLSRITAPMASNTKSNLPSAPQQTQPLVRTQVIEGVPQTSV